MTSGLVSFIGWNSFASINSIITFKLKMNTDFISPSLRMFSWKVVTIRFFRAEWCEHICQLQSSCICLFHEGIEKHYTNMKKKNNKKYREIDYTDFCSTSKISNYRRNFSKKKRFWVFEAMTSACRRSALLCRSPSLKTLDGPTTSLDASHN